MTSTLFTGAAVWTPGWTSSRPADVRISGDRIVDIGPAGSMSDGRVVRLDGGLLLPAFQDAHVHPLAGGLGLLTCDLSAATSVDEILRLIERYAESTPHSEWLTGQGWSKHVIAMPDRQLLDRVTGDRPAVFRSSDCHSVWANSAALRLAGIDASTPDPERGRIVRDAGGHSSGLLDEAAIHLVQAVTPELSDAEIDTGLLRGESQLLDLGIASWQDAIVGTGLGMHDTLPAYARLIRDGRLTGRVTAALWWDPARGIEQLDEIQERRKVLEASGTADAVIADTAKVMIDGAGLTFLEPAIVRDLTIALDRLGISIHFHACSDHAVRSALDAVEAARAENGHSRTHHHIAHIMVIAAADLVRFRALGVTANMQAAWATDLPPFQLFHEQFIDAHPEHHSYAFGQLARHGAHLCAGSDWPVSSPDPLVAADVATSRRGVDGPDALESLDLGTFLTAYTAGSAHVNGRGDRTGRVAEGQLADLVHLGTDPFRTGLAGARVDGLWVGGVRVRGSE